MASTSAQGGDAPAAADPGLQPLNLSAEPMITQELEPRTLAELKLITLGGAIRDKAHWNQKIKDPAILSKWRQEAVDQAAAPATVDYILSEQEHLASVYPHNMYPAAVPGVFAADDYMPQDLRAELLQGIKELEAQGEPDWHPGSNEQVRDLVHPSLYPLVYDVTAQITPGTPALTPENCLKAIGSGVPVTTLPAHIPHPGSETSEKFQWLPAEFDVKPDGQVRILSYINNLHPVKHQALYPALASIFQHFVPLFNEVLTHYANQAAPIIHPGGYEWYTGEPQEEDFENKDAHEAAWLEWRETRVPIQPEIPAFQPPPPPKDVVDLKGRRLQVIVKLASIHLTPEKPEYPGGSWHVEGMLNENIVATGIYYCDQHNVQPSSIAFRAAVVDQNLEYEQNDSRGVKFIYGLEDESPSSQSLGSVTTLPDRCLCFPNYMQHRVEPFKLQDPSQPGHRKILVYWLVHPATRIMSTERVPPQQLDWLKQGLFQDPEFWPSALPEMALKMVEDRLDDASQCPYSLKKAREYRHELMDERKYYVEYQNEESFERPVSLCEH